MWSGGQVPRMNRLKENKQTKKTKAKGRKLMGVGKSRNKFLPDASLAFLNCAQPHSARAANYLVPGLILAEFANTVFPRK